MGSNIMQQIAFNDAFTHVTKDKPLTWDTCEKAITEAAEHLPKASIRKDGSTMSQEAEDILVQRDAACRNGDFTTFTDLSYQYRKLRKKEKRQALLDTVNLELDERSTWNGVKRIKSSFQPKPFGRKKHNTNKTLGESEIPDEAAKYLSSVQWKQPEEFKPLFEHKIIFKQLPYNLEPPTLKELSHVIKRMKNNKAPGPDGIPMETFKEMTVESLSIVLEIIRNWWIAEDMPNSLLQAKVALIYKKGDSTLMENYRPISLLKSIYKLFAKIPM
jgi:hypothetical protein